MLLRFLFLKDKADKSATAFVYNAFKGFLKLESCFNGHMMEFCMKALIDEIIK